jgi:hypothetical protein
LHLSDIAAGDYVQVLGDEVNGGFQANEVRRRGPEGKVKLHARFGPRIISSPPTGSITLLGAEFGTDAGTESERDDSAGDESLTADEFFADAGVVDATAVIELEDEFAMPGTWSATVSPTRSNCVTDGAYRRRRIGQ